MSSHEPRTGKYRRRPLPLREELTKHSRSPSKVHEKGKQLLKVTARHKVTKEAKSAVRTREKQMQPLRMSVRKQVMENVPGF